MQLARNRYQKNDGWIHPHATDLDSEQTLVLFFADQSYCQHPAVTELEQAFPKSAVIGCSTSGEIYQGEIYDDSLVCVVMKLERTPFRILCERNYAEKNTRECGQQFANQLYSFDLHHVLLLSSGLNINIDEFIVGFKTNAGRNIPMFGGIAGDGERFEKTWVYYQGFSDNMILAIGLYGDALQISQGCAGGWTKLGVERRITRSRDNILYEIDDQPALQIYKKYLGDLADKLPSSALLFPLSIRKDQNSQSVVRTILNVDDKNNAIVFAGEIPQGWYTSLMRCSKQGLIEGAHAAAQMCHNPNQDAELSIIVSCVGRRMVLGQAAFHEIATVTNLLNQDNKMTIGFYSYGEIASEHSQASNLHNQTMTLATLYEKGND